MSNIREKYDLIIKKLGLDVYYKAGFKGHGVKIASVETIKSGHGEMVYKTLKTYAPEAEVLSFNDETGLTATGDQNTEDTIIFPKFADWCIENKVDIVTSSINFSCEKESEIAAIKKLYENEIIYFNCVPNKDEKECKISEEITKTYNIKYECMSVGGLFLTIDGKESYNFAYGEGVDVLSYNTNIPYIVDDYENMEVWSGNSAATPLVAATVAVYKSAFKYVNSKNIDEMIDNNYVPFEYKDRTYRRLCLNPNIDFNIESSNENSENSEDNNEEIPEWKIEFIEAWKTATEKGIVDGNRPDDNITRNELIVILHRLNLI